MWDLLKALLRSCCLLQLRSHPSLFHCFLSRIPAFDHNMNLLQPPGKRCEGGIVPDSKTTHRCIAVRIALSRLLFCPNSLPGDSWVSTVTLLIDAKSFTYQFP